MSKKLNMTREEFRQKILEFRHAGGMTQEELADYLGGITTSTIQKWERGAVVPNSSAMIGKLLTMRVLDETNLG